MILINRSLLALIVLCLMVSINSFATPSSSAIPIKRVIVFGDSLSDDGNDYLTLQPVRAMIGRITALHNTFPTDLVPSAYHEPYFDGRFSNGPVWVEQLAHLFGIMDTNNHRAGHFQFIDFAYGGALARGNSLASDVFPMPLNEQVADYLLHSITYVNKDKTLAVLLIGANDYLDNTKKSFDPKDVTPVIDAQLSAIKTVYHSGVHHFLIANLPRLDLTPLAKVRGNAYQQKERALVSASNQALKTALDQLSADKHYKDIHITYYDLSEVHSMLDSRLTEFGYGDPSLARTPCYPMYPVPNLVSTYVHLNQHQSLIAN